MFVLSLSIRALLFISLVSAAPTNADGALDLYADELPESPRSGLSRVVQLSNGTLLERPADHELASSSNSTRPKFHELALDGPYQRQNYCFSRSTNRFNSKPIGHALYLAFNQARQYFTTHGPDTKEHTFISEFSSNQASYTAFVTVDLLNCNGQALSAAQLRAFISAVQNIVGVSRDNVRTALVHVAAAAGATVGDGQLLAVITSEVTRNGDLLTARSTCTANQYFGPKPFCGEVIDEWCIEDSDADTACYGR